MATIYVNSAAAGAGDGTSFADAFTAMADAVAVVAAGDIVRTASTHAESLAAAVDIGITGIHPQLVYFVSVNPVTDEEEAGASIVTTDTISLRNCHMVGFNLSCEGDVNPGSLLSVVHMERCTVSCLELNVFALQAFRSIDCDWTLTSPDRGIPSPDSFLTFLGGSISAPNGSAGTHLLEAAPSFSGDYEFIGVDMTAVTHGRFFYTPGDRAHTGTARAIGCRIPNAFVPLTYDAPTELAVEFINCEAGIPFGTATEAIYSDFFGQVVANGSSGFRDDGATDGNSSFSMRMTAIGGTTLKSLRGLKSFSKGMTKWVPAGSTNISIFLAHGGVGSGANGRLQNNECWAYYQGPNEETDPNATLRSVSTRGGFGATPTDLPDDDSSWTGTDVGTAQRIDIPIAPTISGYCHVWVYFAPESGSDVSISVDPKIEVT